MKNFLCLFLGLGLLNSCGKGGGGGSGGNGGGSDQPPPTIGFAKIVNGTHHCNNPWSPKNILNDSENKSLKIVVKKTVTLNSQNPRSETLVFDSMAPKEQRQLGCSGCGFTTTGQLCEDYVVLSAVEVPNN